MRLACRMHGFFSNRFRYGEAKAAQAVGGWEKHMKRMIPLVLLFSSFALGENSPEPQGQSHTLESEIFARALLSPLGQSKISGTVEFQHSDNKITALITLANGERGKRLAMRLVDIPDCPDPGQAIGGFPKKISELGTVAFVKGGMGNRTVDLKGLSPTEDKKRIVNKVVLVGNKPWLACGKVDSTQPAQTADSPVREKKSSE